MHSNGAHICASNPSVFVSLVVCATRCIFSFTGSGSALPAHSVDVMANSMSNNGKYVFFLLTASEQHADCDREKVCTWESIGFMMHWLEEVTVGLHFVEKAFLRVLPLCIKAGHWIRIIQADVWMHWFAKLSDLYFYSTSSSILAACFPSKASIPSTAKTAKNELKLDQTPLKSHIRWP